MVCSAHRTPDKAAEFAKNAEDKGIGVIIAAAGKAAHLPGVIAAYTALPVIGIPIKSSTMDGLDSLFSIVQMPSGIPVATVAIETGELFFADSRQDNLQGHMIDYILASASIPPFFPPVFINKKHWFDGGLRDITPLGAAFQENPDEIIVILTFPVNSQLEPILPQISYPGVLQSLLRALHILTTEISANDLQYAQLVNTYYRLFPGTRRVPIRIISPSKPLAGDILDFDPSTIRINIKEGYQAARNLLKENPQIITTIS
jgi:predicted patatin/cPLA2 family phospholipase